MSEESQYSFHHALTPSGNWPVEQGGSIVPEVAQRAIDKAVYFGLEGALKQVKACDDTDSHMGRGVDVQLLREACRAKLSGMFLLGKGEIIDIFTSDGGNTCTNVPDIEEDLLDENGLCKVFFDKGLNDKPDVECAMLVGMVRDAVLTAVDWENLPKRFKADELENKANMFDCSSANFGNALRWTLREFARDVGNLFADVPDGLVERLENRICKTFAGGCDDGGRFKKHFVGVLRSESLLPFGVRMLEFCGWWGKTVSDVIDNIYLLYFWDDDIEENEKVNFLKVYVKDLMWLKAVYENGFAGEMGMIGANITRNTAKSEEDGDGDVGSPGSPEERVVIELPSRSDAGKKPKT